MLVARRLREFLQCQSPAAAVGHHDDAEEVRRPPSSPGGAHNAGSFDVWVPTRCPTPRRAGPTDWSALKKQGLEWVVPRFSGGPATRRDPRIPFGVASGDDDIPLHLYTPRQQRLFRSLQLPKAALDKVAQDSLLCLKGVRCAHDRRAILRDAFRNFVVELTRGAYFTHLDTGKQYVSIHCRLLQSLDALTIDTNNGRRVEFPTRELGAVYVLIKEPQPCDEDPNRSKQSRNSNNDVPRLDLASILARDYLVIVPFRYRKIAFVFRDEVEAERFKLCLELLALYVETETENTVSPCSSPTPCGRAGASDDSEGDGSRYRSQTAQSTTTTETSSSSSSCSSAFHRASSPAPQTDLPPGGRHRRRCPPCPLTIPPPPPLQKPPVPKKRDPHLFVMTSSAVSSPSPSPNSATSCSLDDGRVATVVNTALSQLRADLLLHSSSHDATSRLTTSSPCVLQVPSPMASPTRSAMCPVELQDIPPQNAAVAAATDDPNTINPLYLSPPNIEYRRVAVPSRRRPPPLLSKYV